ncbi:MAG: AbgT family transporter [Anaeromicrobium sp.]|uniref:AbgT family transporter n=1 Tax=Anaeromicrobium sp. TaxID=1929132 RepID=UPI0025ED9061|nr:AbgT family transporter [Anaeromicrobium sp.]MCT4594790.1 AbgT family transporter [Anaeromicrobium sp.]
MESKVNSKKPGETGKKSKFEKFISGVENIGNKLPHPFWLFVSLSIIIMVLSFALAQMGVEVTYLKASKVATEAPEEVTIAVRNLLSKEALQSFFTNFTSNYSGFAPLGLVMIMMLGVGLLEQTGMLSALIRKTILSAPLSMLIFIIALVGVNANLASDAGVIVVPAIAGAVFKSLGINPWIGVISGYVAANGGFSANIFIAGTDALLAGITESVTQGLGIDAPVHPLMNWYFMIASTFVVVGSTVFVTKFFTEKHLGGGTTSVDNSELKNHQLTEDEKKGLFYSAVAAVAFIGVMLILVIPADSIFRNAQGNLLPKSPLLSSIVSILFFFFFTLAMAYGKGSGTIKNMEDVPKFMQKGVSGALGFMVIALPASVFINLFSASKISTVIGVYGGELLKTLDMTGFPLLVAFVFICTGMNLCITSGSAKWLIIAPVFVPLFNMLGFSPALTQATYRIADTCTNIISPIDYYVPVIMGLLATYNVDEDRKVGIGTVISLCLPYSIAYMIGLLGLLLIWYTFKLPLGPGVPMFM